jgi:ADP-ribose pyrophosphatase
VTVPRATLPEAPKVELETLRETRIGEGGFLELRRVELVTVQDGTRSQSFPYDLVERRALDACVMAAHHVDEGRVWVWLRSSVRPPIGLRRDERASSAVLWELPAGLIEPGESPRAAAARELAEELGFEVTESALSDLGPPAFPAPGCIGEVHHFFHVEVAPATRAEPKGDGSPVEAGATVIAIPLEEALAACRRGALPDEKTELALRRLAEVLS